MRTKQFFALLVSSALGGGVVTSLAYEKDVLPFGHRPSYVKVLEEEAAENVRNLANEIITKNKEIENYRKISELQEEQARERQALKDKTLEAYPILKYGLPGNFNDLILSAIEFEKDNFIPSTLHLFRKYISESDFAKKTPKWVADTLLPNQKNNPQINRKNSIFKQDPDGSIPVPFRCSNADYFNSGYHRGHMIPAGNMYTADSQLDLDETFYLNNNIIPQNGRNNAGYWRRVEHFVRNLPDKLKTPVHTITGPLYLPSAVSEPVDLSYGNNVTGIVHYPVIGKNQVHVPTHLYKVILAEPLKDGDQKHSVPAITAFLIPNAPIRTEEPLKNFEIDIKQLERISGLQFFLKARTVDVDYDVETIDDYVANTTKEEDQALAGKPMQHLLRLPSICDWLQDGCKLASEDPSLEYMFQIHEAKSEEELEKIWREHEKANIKVHQWTQDSYNQKKDYFARKKNAQQVITG